MKRYRRRDYLMFVLPSLLFILIFIYYPIIQNLINSFYKMNTYSDESLFIGLKNYIRIFKNEVFYISLRNNFFYAVISVLCQVGFGLIIGIILENPRFRKHSRFFSNIYFIPSVISITAVGLLWYFIYHPSIGLLNQALSLIDSSLARPWLGDPSIAIFAIIMMSQWQYTGYIAMLLIIAIQKIPQQIYDAASIDGANEIQKAIHITIPSVRPMIIVASTITIIGAYKLFTEIYVTTMGGPYNSTQVLGTYLYNTAFLYDDLGGASAIGMVIFIITITLSLLQVKLEKADT